MMWSRWKRDKALVVMVVTMAAFSGVRVMGAQVGPRGGSIGCRVSQCDAQRRDHHILEACKRVDICLGPCESLECVEIAQHR